MDMSDHWLLTTGLAAAMIATWAWFADRRRAQRRHLDRVGFMPWTGVFFFALFVAVLLLGAALKVEMAPG